MPSVAEFNVSFYDLNGREYQELRQTMFTLGDLIKQYMPEGNTIESIELWQDGGANTIVIWEQWKCLQCLSTERDFDLSPYNTAFCSDKCTDEANEYDRKLRERVDHASYHINPATN